MEEPTATWLDLYDWRQRVARMYRDREAGWRSGEDEAAILARFRAERDALFARHPQSPLSAAAQRSFSGLPYFPHNPALKLEATLEPDSRGEPIAFDNGSEAMLLQPAAHLRFSIEGVAAQLTVYWVAAYGGGLLLPFRDATCPAESYGGGRYLFDTVKGSDFLRLDAGATTPLDEMRQPGYAGGRVIVDFNYAYNPSCAYDIRWVCPLAPRENWLSLPISAGEMRFHDLEGARMKRGNPVSALLDEALGRLTDQMRISKSNPLEVDAAALAKLLSSDGSWPPAPSLAVREATTQPTELLPLLNRRNRRWRKDYMLDSISVASPVPSAPPNDLIHALHLYRSDHPTAPTMIYVHGWGVRRLQMRLNLGLRWLGPLGMNLLLVEQPYHMQRSPERSRYSGEFSIGANLPQTVSTVQQSVWDTQVMISWLLAQGVESVGVAGESLGGLVTALVAQFEPRIAYAIPLMPAVRLDRVFWRSRLSRQVRVGLRQQGLTPQSTAYALRAIMPGRYPLAIDPQRVMLMQGSADRVAFPEYTTRLAQRWGARLELSGHSHTTELFGISTRRRIQKFLSEI